MARFSVSSVLLAVFAMIAVAGCSDPEGGSIESANRFFAAIRERDGETAHSLAQSHYREHHSIKRMGRRIAKAPALAHHKSVSLKTAYCRDWGCNFRCTLEPGNVPCTFKTFETGGVYYIESLRVQGPDGSRVTVID